MRIGPHVGRDIKLGRPDSIARHLGRAGGRGRRDHVGYPGEGSGNVCARFGIKYRRPDRGIAGGREHNREGEGRPLSRPAAGNQPATHELDQVSTDRQSKPRSAMAGTDTVLGLVKGIEQARKLGRLHPGPGVGHLDKHRMAMRFFSPGPQPKRNRARVRKLDRIRQQIVQHLAQTHGVAPHHGWNLVSALDPEIQPLGPDGT